MYVHTFSVSSFNKYMIGLHLSMISVIVSTKESTTAFSKGVLPAIPKQKHNVDVKYYSHQTYAKNVLS